MLAHLALHLTETAQILVPVNSWGSVSSWGSSESGAIITHIELYAAVRLPHIVSSGRYTYYPYDNVTVTLTIDNSYLTEIRAQKPIGLAIDREIGIPPLSRIGEGSDYMFEPSDDIMFPLMHDVIKKLRKS